MNINRILITVTEPISRIFKIIFSGILKGFGGHRVPRYFWVSVGGLVGIWAMALSYLTLTPKTYQSGFTLILPGAGAGASVNLNAIGQASSLSESAFSNSRVSPTESYKRLLMSDRINDAAKKKASTPTFPRPRIKLLDQTQFMEVSVKAETADAAHEYAKILNGIFMEEVNKLRIEERNARESGYQEMLAGFETNVSAARAALLRHQSQSGLASLDQYHENVATVEKLHAELNASLVGRAEAREKLDALISSLNITTKDASTALSLAADPVFLSLATSFAKVEAEFARSSFKLGANHPKRRILARERDGIKSQLIARGTKISDMPSNRVLSIASKVLRGEYTTLLKQIVDANASFQSLKKKSSALSETVERERKRVEAQSKQAAKLDDLARAHQVSEAVFRSSMARIETNKTDLFASYPLIQTVEPPHLPANPATPIKALGLLGAAAASVMYLLGLALLCLRLPLLRALSKTS